MNEHLPKILIVDDKPNNLYALGRMLSSLKIEIVEADSGKSALLQVMKHDFFLVLLDVNMPDMDGFETADLILSNKNTANTPIIFLTANDRDVHFSIKGYRTGAVDYICKPFNEEILLGKVTIFRKLWQQNALLTERNNELETLTTALAEAGQKQVHDSLHDPLTGLPNRKLFLERGKHYIELAKRAKSHFVLVMLDLNGFKAINDTLGHRAGDFVLKEASNRLTALLKTGDTLARIDGDDFCLILNEKTRAQAATIIEPLVEAFDLPIEYEEHMIPLVVVLGLWNIQFTVKRSMIC